jgi:hypothetical protein
VTGSRFSFSVVDATLLREVAGVVDGDWEEDVSVTEDWERWSVSKKTVKLLPDMGGEDDAQWREWTGNVRGEVEGVRRSSEGRCGWHLLRQPERFK